MVAHFIYDFNVLAKPVSILSSAGEPPSARALLARPRVSPHFIRGHTSPHSLRPIRMGPVLAISPQCTVYVTNSPHCTSYPHVRASSTRM